MQTTIKLYNDLLNLVHRKQFGKIKKIYLKNKNKDKFDSSIWNIFAEATSHLGDYKEVAYCCKKITILEPENYHARYNYALALQHLNKTDEAIEAYEQCIAINVQYSNAYANCALLYNIQNQPEKAIQYFIQAINLNKNTEVEIQLAKTYADCGNITSAINTYIKIIHEYPDNDKARFYLAQLYYETEDYLNAENQYLHLYQKNKLNIRVINNLGRLYEQVHNLDKAIDFYNQALAIDNKLAVTQRNLARIWLNKFKMTDQKEYLDNAIQTYNKAIEIEPGNPEPYYDLGRIYQQLEQTDLAVKYFEQALGMDIPDDFKKANEFILAARYFLSSVSNPADFNSDKKAYIANLFDGYAHKFDHHLVQELEYKTPELIAKKLTELTNPESKYEIIDLGCGTGLCAPFLSKQAKNLTGIDLSEKMIEKAALLNLYDDLIVGDITEEMLAAEKNYDLVVAADVFVYIGQLDEIFRTCHKKMHNNGLFIYSTELLDEDNEAYKLVDTGRYKHSVSHLNSLAEKNNFKILSNEQCLLRKEYGKSIVGTLTVLQK